MILLLIYCILCYLIILACIIEDFTGTNTTDKKLAKGESVIMFIIAPVIITLFISSLIIEKIKE